MFTRSIYIVAPAALCLVSAFEVFAQSPLSISWPTVKKAPADEVAVKDNFPIVSQPQRPPEMSRSDRKLIEPKREDIARFRELLSRDGYGIAKILNLSCGADSPMVIDADGCADSIPGHGADYSFRTGGHSLPEFCDIKLKQGRFISGSIMTQGLIARLGEIDLLRVDPGRVEVKYLAAFVPAESLAGAQKQTSLINRGIWNDGHFYSGSVEIKENQTYVLRSIAYRIKGYIADKRRDIIVAFQVVRQDEDGNVTLVWKELQNKESPRLK